MQLRAALASALDDGDMAASSAGRSDQLQPSLSSPAGQQKSTQPSAALAEAPIKADQSTEMLSESAQQQPKQLAGTQGAIARIGDDNIAPVKVEQDDSSAGPQMEVSVTSAAIEVPQGTATVQDRSMSEPGSSGRDHAADLAGTLYETVLLAILEGLRSALSAGGVSLLHDLFTDWFPLVHISIRSHDTIASHAWPGMTMLSSLALSLLL